MLPNGPPLGRPGLGSQVSNWLGAPHNHSKMHSFCALRVSAAKTELWKSPEKLATAAAPPPTSPLRNNRRCSRCSSVRHCPGVGSMDSEGVITVWSEIPSWSSEPKACREWHPSECPGVAAGMPPPVLPPPHPGNGPARPETLAQRAFEGRSPPTIDPQYCQGPASAGRPSPWNA